MGLQDYVEVAFFGKSETYKKHALKLLTHFFKLIGKSPKKLQPSDIDRFIAYKVKKNKNGTSRRAYIRLTMTYLEKLYRYLASIEENEALRKRYEKLAEHARSRKKDIKIPKNQRRDFLRDDEIKKFLAFLENQPPMWRLLFILMLKYGMRIREALSLKVGNVIYDKHAIRYVSKGEKTEYVFLEDSDDWNLLLTVIRGKTPSEYIFTKSWGGRITYEYARVMFKRFLKMAGFPEERIKRLRLHDLRRTSAIKVYEKTGDIALVKDWLNHEKIETTMIYLDIGKDRYVKKRKVSQEIKEIFG